MKEELRSIFGDRVSCDDLVRRTYSHDMAPTPPFVKRFVQTTPDAVVQPVSAAEVQELARLASAHRVPLVPRGSASGGYGGAVPARGGIVVDFCRMNQVLDIDPAGLRVRVQPGAIWSQVEEAVNAHDLSLRLYPTSAPASTVAGWVAQGGTGIGGYEYGYIEGNVLSAQVAKPDGELTSFSGEDTKYVAGLEGTTGLIVEITLPVRRRDEIRPLLCSFANPADLKAALLSVRGRGLRPWSVQLYSPNFMRLKGKALRKEHLPEGYLAMFGLPSSRREKLEPHLRRIISRYGGACLEKGIADEEWKDRFYSLRLKRLGPSLVVSETIVPIERLDEVIARAESRYSEIAMEGTLAGTSHAALLFLLLADERQRAFPLVYASSLVVSDMAKAAGGRIYSLGMYCTSEAPGFFGIERLRKLWARKRELDPLGIMNPGKVFPSSLDRRSPTKLLSRAIRLASVGKNPASAVGHYLARRQNARFPERLPRDIAWDAFACAQCGFCRPTCTVFEASPWEHNSPRGKWFLLGEYLKGHVQMDERLAHTLFFCSTCKKCDIVCQTRINVVDHWLALRCLLNEREGLELTGLADLRQNILSCGNLWGQPNQSRADWWPGDVARRGDASTAYWVGCGASFVMNNMPENTVRLLDRAGVDFTYLGEEETCCGIWLLLGGYETDAAEKAWHNITLFARRGIDRLLVSCPGCFAAFAEVYPHMAKELGLDWKTEVVHTTVLFSELVKAGRLPFTHDVPLTVTYHDSCHIGRWAGIYEEPRHVLRALPGLDFREMKHNREEGLCCGSLMGFSSREAAMHAGGKRIQEAADTGATVLVTNCNGCGSTLFGAARHHNAPVEVKDITDLMCAAMGLPVRDTSQNVLERRKARAEILQKSRIRRREYPHSNDHAI